MYVPFVDENKSPEHLRKRGIDEQQSVVIAEMDVTIQGINSNRDTNVVSAEFEYGAVVDRLGCAVEIERVLDGEAFKIESRSLLADQFEDLLSGHPDA